MEYAARKAASNAPRKNLASDLLLKNMWSFQRSSGWSRMHVSLLVSHEAVHSSEMVVLTLLNVFRVA